MDEHARDARGRELAGRFQSQKGKNEKNECKRRRYGSDYIDQMRREVPG
jgi:hypothetical protein